MNRRQFGRIASATLLAFGITACGKQTPQTPEKAPAAASLSAAQIYELAASATGFTVGPMMAAHTAYAFFDTACGHCAVLWNSAKPLANKLRIVWIPVGFISRGSAQQGADIVAAADPAQAMDANEARVLSNQPGTSAAASAPADMLKKIQANTELLQKIGADSVPLIIFKHAQTGVYGQQAGAMSSAQLATLLGL